VTLRSLRRTLGAFRAGRYDRTTRLEGHTFRHATHTPDGPATLSLTWSYDPATPAECGLDGEAWGPGRAWLLDRVEAMAGTHDAPVPLPHAPPVLARAMHEGSHMRIGASGNLYHALLPTVIAQRITSGEALRQWNRLCRALGQPAPGPSDRVGDLLLPPAPELLRAQPTWWFHPLGIEVKRAKALIEVARHSDKLWEWAAAGTGTAAGQLRRLPGVGAWTVGSVLGPALGDPDAVAVGDFHLPNIVAWNLAGEPRGDDDRMLELLAPFAGQRGRVLHALTSHGTRPPSFAPRRRTPQIRFL
jgi:3-methyladenine DNA glycosylase/8-oxoguanine DNA glycosylase